ncbi:unnamed protein product [Symbiodinium sp. CCMP2592]|nr:unnamed protein product [Symbiodinium sp. CCMP2592]
MAARDGNTDCTTGINATRGMHLSRPLPYAVRSDQACGGVSIPDLPMTALPDKCMVKHFVDVIMDVPPPNKQMIESVVNQGKWSQAPAPFCPKTVMDVKLITQFVVLPQDNGNMCVLKHVQAPDVKLTRDVIDKLCYGSVYGLKWQGHSVYDFKKGFQWFLEQLGGWQCRFFGLSPTYAHQQKSSGGGFHLGDLSEEDIDKGFAFIEQEAAHLASEYKRVQWITKNQNINADSPIYQWPVGVVEKSLRAIQTDGVLSLPIEDFYLSLADLEFDALHFGINQIIKSMTTRAAGIVGGPGSGKTPLARILALCASRYWKRQLSLTSPPSFREASEFDFFRGQPGRKDRPDIHDDGRLAEEPIRKMKGFTDVGCTMLTKERWGAAKFVQGQFRVFVCNDNDTTAWVEAHKDLVIRPVFPNDTPPPHIMAVLKRANILVNIGKLLVFREAGQHEKSVPCLSMESHVDYRKLDGQQKYHQYLHGKLSKPSSYEKDVEWEASYVDALLNGKTLPKPKPTIRNADAVRRLFRGVSPRREVSPLAVAVKQESFQFRRALTGRLTGQCIDLCSPPKKVSKTAITSDAKAEMPEEVTSNAAGVVDLHAEPVGVHSPSHSDPVPAEASAALVLSPGSQMDVASDVVDPMDDLEAELERYMEED